MFIGVDAGTSVIKAVGFDRSGEVLAAASFPTSTSAPAPGCAEQNLELIIDAVGWAVRKICGECAW